MAITKVTELDPIPATGINGGTDVLPIADVSTGESFKATPSAIVQSALEAGVTIADDVTVEGSNLYSVNLQDLNVASVDAAEVNVTGVTYTDISSTGTGTGEGELTIRGQQKMFVMTPGVCAGTAEVGAMLELVDAATGEAEFTPLENLQDRIANNSIPSSKLKTDSDSDKVQLANLGSAVISSLAGALSAADYLGEITSLSQSIPAASANSGKWYSSTVAGLLTDSDVSTITVAIGDRVVSNGTVWAKYAAPPTSIADGTVTRAKLVTAVSELIPTSGSVSYAGSDEILYAIVDTANRVAIGIKADGSVIGEFTVPDGAVSRIKLAAEVDELIPEDVSDASGYLYSIVDGSGRIGFGIQTDGTITGKLSLADGSITTAEIASGAVTESRIATEFLRAFKSSMSERVVVEQDDDGWRGRQFDVPCTTEADGSMFSPFAPTPTRSLRGINSSGTTLEFRRSAGLSIRGKRYRGTWDPASGAPDTAPLPGDWWNVIASGTFSSITWANGDRIFSSGTMYLEGPNWIKGITGELFYLGEFTPATHAPSNIRDGDVWQASTAGTFSSITFAVNDLLIRESSTWGRIATETVSSVANGVFYSFQTTNSRQIEARRADKSSTRVGILAKGLRTTKAPRSSDAIVMWGDSMVIYNGLHTAISALISPRVFTGVSYSGSQSDQILGAMQKEIRGSDTYRGRLHAFFHGTNNIADLAKTRAAALAMADLAGARDNRVIFLSVIGQMIMQWTGSRLACDQHEQAFAGTNNIAGLESWYNAAFPGQLLNCRASLLAAASTLTTPSLHFPGLTDGDVVDTYGIPPLHYHFNLTTVPWTPAHLTFAGYRSTAGLPTGGSDGQYWLRTANGTVGAVIVRWSGTWTEHTWDATHLSPAGVSVLAAAFAAFLTANSL